MPVEPSDCLPSPGEPIASVHEDSVVGHRWPNRIQDRRYPSIVGQGRVPSAAQVQNLPELEERNMADTENGRPWADRYEFVRNRAINDRPQVRFGLIKTPFYDAKPSFVIAGEV